jgi:Family of unknown function (DUF6188)
MERNEDGSFDLDAVIGATFDSLELAVQVVMRFSAGSESAYVAHLDISETFHVFDGIQSHDVYFGPVSDGAPYGLDVLARLLQERATGCVVTRGVAMATGALELEFSNGWRIDVPFSREYEAWVYMADDGWLAAPIGGGL